MVGYYVKAWSSPTASFPLEAAAVWISAPIASIFTYEMVKNWQYRRHPDKAVFTPPAE